MDLAMIKTREQTISVWLIDAPRTLAWLRGTPARHCRNICSASAWQVGCPIWWPAEARSRYLAISCVAATGTQQQFIMNVGMPGYTIEQLELDYCNGYMRLHLALDCNGLSTSNVADALQAQRLLPFAPEYKGFGLAAMVETLCGVMAGARYASQLVGRQGLFGTDQDVADLGQVYIAIDPMRFCVSFEERLSDFQQLLRDALPWDANQTPLIPGDKESLHMQMVNDQDGLTLSPCTLYVLQELSVRFSIKPLVVR
ncbi:uncharacterized protein LOC132784007 [Drosophila nasuta]|uniref:uncharacterized protein LOC132784007 n=1 Tax=Drosophila nasuta TaxID=42062 RepID=UPI00295E76B2|nr:uncharacterized protein LOC132784007 [Drosophila nasuta]